MTRRASLADEALSPVQHQYSSHTPVAPSRVDPDQGPNAHKRDVALDDADDSHVIRGYN